MQNLEWVYKQRVYAIDQADRYIPIIEIDDVVIVNFDCVFERDYSIRAADQLIYLLHKLGHSKRFIFISEDGAVLQQSGAVEIVRNIIHCFELNPSTCLVVSREDLNISNATCLRLDAIPYWCHVLYPTIKDITIPHPPFNKKFAVWFNRGTFLRAILAQHLITNYNEDCFISYQESGVLIDRNLVGYFQEEINWANNNTPIVYDRLFPNRMFTHDMIVGSIRKPYDEYFMEIVVETDNLTTSWITEKTVKNLYIGKPFIVAAGPGILDKIKSFGFQTFSPWIDESYDQIENNYLRVEAIKKEIDRIAALSCAELEQMHKELLPILEHNRQTYGKYINLWR
jgi:hypothetical protein